MRNPALSGTFIPNYAIRMKADNVIAVDKDILGGIPVFKGTRVPVKNLFDYLQAGNSINDFLEDFDYITFEQCHAVLDISYQALINTVLDEITADRKTSDFRGKLNLSPEQYEDFQNHVKDIRNERKDNI